MGAWDTKPWDNDGAADWFGDLFDATKLREHVVAALKLNIDEGHEEIRAAAWMLINLGRTYVWPIDHFDDDLKLACRRLEEVKEYDIYAEVPEFVEEIENEILILQHRIKNKSEELPKSEKLRDWWFTHAEP